MAETIVLEPSRAARFYAFSSSPEEEAWSKMQKWAESRGLWTEGVLLDPGAKARIYGYNNPNPSVGSPNYGYEFLVTGVSLRGAPEIIELSGGTYYVTSFAGDDPYQLPEAWKAHVDDAEHAGLELGHHQWLERHLPPGFHVQLYLPVK
jgi:hypothetical protein